MAKVQSELERRLAEEKSSHVGVVQRLKQDLSETRKAGKYHSNKAQNLKKDVHTAVRPEIDIVLEFVYWFILLYK